MAHHADPLTQVIQKALADHGVVSLRAAADATGITKDAIKRRYDGETPWTIPDLDKVADFLGVPASTLKALAEDAA